MGDSRIHNPLRWGRARDRRTAWLLRAFAAWRWVLRWRWCMACGASWDLRTSTSWARFVSRTLDLARLETGVDWALVRIVRGNAPRALAHV